MRRLIDEASATDRDHLIDAIGKLVAAILDMHRRLAMHQVLAGDIGDARHRSAALYDEQSVRVIDIVRFIRSEITVDYQCIPIPKPESKRAISFYCNLGYALQKQSHELRLRQREVGCLERRAVLW